MEEINDHILVPTLKGLNEEGFKYKGILYFGLMLTESGPKVLEYNCRFGDPETQVVLPLLKNDFSDVIKATVNGSLSGVKLDWSKDTSACVVMASRGYPGKYKTGLPIGGLQQVNDNNVTVFHAGTALKNNRLVTSGGRVLAVTATDKSLPAALKRAYQAVERIRFNGAQFRRDIGRTGKPVPAPPPPTEPTQPPQPSA
jgi:phosphoribosylamine--glycine ligase